MENVRFHIYDNVKLRLGDSPYKMPNWPYIQLQLTRPIKGIISVINMNVNRYFLRLKIINSNESFTPYYSREIIK